ncbi:MAG: FliH/SctL family protein [Pyrinomonadaceae bacterium]
MLPKVIKFEHSGDVCSFAIPVIGEPLSRPKGVNEFVIPDFEPVRFKTAQDQSGPARFLDADDILQNARDEAARIIAQAEEHGEIIQQVAVDTAVHKTEASFETQVAERVAEIRGLFTDNIVQIAGLSQEIAARAETEIVELALSIAKKIVGHEVTVNRDVALELIKVSLGKLHNRSVAEVHLNPEDLAFVEAHSDKLDFRGTLKLVEDKSISVGGCLIHTETGDIDARIESQFDEIANGLFT